MNKNMQQNTSHKYFELAKSIDIVQYIKNTLKIDSKFNSNLLCPFHNGHSFSIEPKKQFFHCFSCDASGDIVKFAELYYHP